MKNSRILAFVGETYAVCRDYINDVLIPNTVRILWRAGYTDLTTEEMNAFFPGPRNPEPSSGSSQDFPPKPRRIRYEVEERIAGFGTGLEPRHLLTDPAHQKALIRLMIDNGEI